jgi:K+-sensing histidine kinase KdpD
MFKRHAQWIIASGILLLAMVILSLDCVALHFSRFPILYILPVMLAAWYGGRTYGFFLAIAMPLLRLWFVYVAGEHIPWSLEESCLNAVIRVLTLTLIAWLTARVAVQHAALQHRVKVLEGLLPICCFCKKIRDSQGDWQPLERYICTHSEAEFTHSICPHCGKENYGDHFPDPSKPTGK